MRVHLIKGIISEGENDLERGEGGGGEQNNFKTKYIPLAEPPVRPWLGIELIGIV